jgi:hypothetical protein
MVTRRRYGVAVRVVGIVVDVRGTSRPACSVTLLDDASGKPEIQSAFELTSSEEAVAQQLNTLQTSLKTRLKGLLPLDRVVVRRADVSPRPSNKEGPRLRLMAEGALIAAAAGVVPDTLVGAGLELGRWHGSDKTSVDTAGAALVSEAGLTGTAALRRQYSAASAAALAGYTKA